MACLQRIAIALQGNSADGALILENSIACQDWGRTDESFGLSKAVKAVFDDGSTDHIATVELNRKRIRVRRRPSWSSPDSNS